MLSALNYDTMSSLTNSICCRQCPVLQDMDCDVAWVLACCTEWSTEEILTNLMKVALLERLQSVRTFVFEYTIGTIIECEDPERHIDTSQHKPKHRKWILDRWAPLYIVRTTERPYSNLHAQIFNAKSIPICPSITKIACKMKILIAV